MATTTNGRVIRTPATEDVLLSISKALDYHAGAIRKAMAESELNRESLAIDLAHIADAQKWVLDASLEIIAL